MCVSKLAKILGHLITLLFLKKFRYKMQPKTVLSTFTSDSKPSISVTENAASFYSLLFTSCTMLLNYSRFVCRTIILQINYIRRYNSSNCYTIAACPYGATQYNNTTCQADYSPVSSQDRSSIILSKQSARNA